MLIESEAQRRRQQQQQEEQASMIINCIIKFVNKIVMQMATAAEQRETEKKENERTHNEHIIHLKCK